MQQQQQRHVTLDFVCHAILLTLLCATVCTEASPASIRLDEQNEASVKKPEAIKKWYSWDNAAVAAAVAQPHKKWYSWSDTVVAPPHKKWYDWQPLPSAALSEKRVDGVHSSAAQWKRSAAAAGEVAHAHHSSVHGFWDPMIDEEADWALRRL